MNDENNDPHADILRCCCADCAVGTAAECTSKQLRRALTDIFDDKLPATGLYCRNHHKTASDDAGDCRCPGCHLNPGDGQAYCR
ncbi:MAG: hypothetical protein P3T54_08070 [Dehalogenimonas sp.]|uniref:DUF2769 domain-containing protein n=1 Tax=Candidatus Dehalogenimonas loeffleri TaxID=3127115 RepID=A0ABZ2J3Y6_9CHLR|nr:hypothetical protein [Dehalogenimonas sp.]